MGAGIILNGGGRQRRAVVRPRLRGVLLQAALLACCGTRTLAAADGTADWRDVESRIQFAYYTEDAAALRVLGGTLEPAETRDALRSYYAALLAWRQALLAATGGGGGARPADYGGRCVSAAGEMLAQEPGSAEGYALRAACLTLPPATAGSAVSLGRRARSDLGRAQQLAPRNPRVLLVTALVAESLGGDRAATDPLLEATRRAVAAFEAERGGVEPVPGWGAAEAWLLCGRQLLSRGDAVGARDALEHALLIAPDYVQARRLMARLTSG